jgi:nucleoside-diphosphate-sugar epimerase
MRAFVTGGSGFVGRELIRALRARGDEVRALSRSEKADATLREVGAEPVRGDLDGELVPGMTGCDVVFHAAAKVEDWGPREEFLRINVEGTRRVVDAARKAGVKRLVHVSTEAQFVGGPPLIDIDETCPRPERPMGIYPESKGMAEAVAIGANGGGLETIAIRPRFVWGRGDSTLLPQMVQVVRSGQWAWIAGGHYLTSTCHVRNVAEGALCAADRGRGGEAYFLTDGPPVEFRGFITAMIETQGVTPGTRSLPRWAAYAGGALCEGLWSVLPLKGRPPLTRSIVKLIGEQVTVVDGKARRELGYEGKVTREQGLEELRQPSMA